MHRAMVLVLLIATALLTFGVKPAAACGWRGYGYGYGYGAYHRPAYRYRAAYRPRVYGWRGWGLRRGWRRW
jgi:hypothetical protein